MDPDYNPQPEDGQPVPAHAPPAVTTPLKSPPPTDFSLQLASLL